MDDHRIEKAAEAAFHEMQKQVNEHYHEGKPENKKRWSDQTSLVRQCWIAAVKAAVSTHNQSPMKIG